MLQDIQTPQSNDAAMNAERHQQINIKHAHCQPSMFKTLQSIPHSPHPTLGALQLPGALQHWLQVLCRTRTLQYLHRWSPCSPWHWIVPKAKLEATWNMMIACYIFFPRGHFMLDILIKPEVHWNIIKHIVTSLSEAVCEEWSALCELLWGTSLVNWLCHFLDQVFRALSLTLWEHTLMEFVNLTLGV